MLIPHQPIAFESRHPIEPGVYQMHSKCFLLPHARGVVIQFDDRSQIEDFADKLSFGDEDMRWALLPAPGGPRITGWNQGQFVVAGSTWQSIVIEGNAINSAFTSSINSKGSLWGYRYTCRPARDDELPICEDETPDVNRFEAATAPQEDGGSSWREVVSHAFINPIQTLTMTLNLIGGCRARD